MIQQFTAWLNSNWQTVVGTILAFSFLCHVPVVGQLLKFVLGF